MRVLHIEIDAVAGYVMTFVALHVELFFQLFRLSVYQKRAGTIRTHADIARCSDVDRGNDVADIGNFVCLPRLERVDIKAVVLGADVRLVAQ